MKPAEAQSVSGEKPADRSNERKDKWVPLVETAGREVFEWMLSAELKRCAERPEGPLDMTAMVGLAGQLCGIISIRCSRETVSRMAGKMLGTPPPPGSQEARDAFGEVCNMVAGNFKNKLTGLGENCMLSVPTVIAGSDYSLHSPDSEPLELDFLFDGKPLVITLDIHN
jgi:chemotaxis protein CheX